MMINQRMKSITIYKEEQVKEKYLTTKEIAEALHVSVTTVNNWRKAGLKCKKMKRDGARTGYGFLLSDAKRFWQGGEDYV